MNGLKFSLLFLLSAEGIGCEALPTPYQVLSNLDLDYKGYATSSDYLRYTKDSKLFQQVDLDRDSKVTVKEIHLHQEAYQAKCQRVQEIK